MVDRNNKVIIKQNSVYKDIKRMYNVSHVPIIQNELNLRGLRCPMLEEFTIRDLNHISYSYTYVDGENRAGIDDEEYIKIVNDTSDFIESCSLQSLCHVSFYDKTDVFLNEVSRDDVNELQKEIISSLGEIYGDIKKNYECTYLVHGDLDYSNLIWNDAEYTIIDFDECCLAPKGMDCAIALARLIKNKVGDSKKLPIEVGELIDRYEIDVNLIKLYIIKVIAEKLYLGQKEIINPNDIEQRRDSIETWYMIFENIDVFLCQEELPRVKMLESERENYEECDGDSA